MRDPSNGLSNLREREGHAFLCNIARHRAGHSYRSERKNLKRKERNQKNCRRCRTRNYQALSLERIAPRERRSYPRRRPTKKENIALIPFSRWGRAKEVVSWWNVDRWNAQGTRIREERASGGRGTAPCYKRDGKDQRKLPNEP